VLSAIVLASAILVLLVAVAVLFFALLKKDGQGGGGSSGLTKQRTGLPSPCTPSPEGALAPSAPTPHADSTPQPRLATSSYPASPSVLTAVSGSLAGQQFFIPPEGLHIGRSPDNQIVLIEPMVSRQHAQILPRAGDFVVFDRNSINGTFVDGLRTYEKVLRPGNRIQLGLSEFIFHVAGSPLPQTPTTESAGAVALPSYGAATRSYEGYQLGPLIGGGGMAEVYRASAPDGHPVAIKIPKVANDPYLMRKFVREGEAIGSLLRGHAHIVQVEKFGYAQSGVPFIVMELVEGGSLRERARQQFSKEDIRRIVGQTCLALAYAHQNKIVHRDIKPENILLTARGDVKVADFGIAKELSGVTVTHKGPVGTPEYMSPEQARGEEVLPASDVYAVGIVLYELLTGRVPFPRRTTIQDDVKQALDVVERHIKETPHPPQQIRPGVPDDLAAIALRALEKQAGRRYKDGGVMAAALGFKPEQISAPHAGSPARLIILEGLKRGQNLTMNNAMIELGRGQLDPDDTTISRRHAVIRRRGNEFWLEDVSTNGTWVNNHRMSSEQMVFAGDHIRIGKSVLRLEK
jgi:serine/threonine protein kinase